MSLLATLVLQNLFVEAHRIIGWAVACSVVAALVGPLVGRVAHIVPRPIALIVVGLAIAAVVSVLVYGVFDDLDTETARLREDGVAAAQELEDRTDRIGQGARELDLVDRATAFFTTLDDRISSGSDALRSAAGTAPTYFVNWILTIFLIIYGGRIVGGAIGLLRDEERETRIHAIVAEGSKNATRYVAASILQGLVIALLAAGAVLALDLPAPVLLPLLAGTMAMLPYIGVLIGALPLVLLAAGLESIAAGDHSCSSSRRCSRRWRRSPFDREWTPARCTSARRSRSSSPPSGTRSTASAQRSTASSSRSSCWPSPMPPHRTTTRSRCRPRSRPRR